MEDNERKIIISEMMEMYPLFRKALFNPMSLCIKGITKTQLITLFFLEANPVLNMSQLASEITVSVQQLTKIVNALEEKGYVERFIDKNNRRLILVKMTEQGKVFIKSHNEFTINNMLKYFKSLTDEEMKILQESAINIKNIVRKIEK